MKNTSNEILTNWNQWLGGIQCETTNKLWNSNELIHLSHKIAHDLSTLGINAGDISAIIVGNNIAFPVLLMALLTIDSNPLLLHIGTPKTELDSLQSKISIKWLLLDSHDPQARIQTDKYSKKFELSIGPIKIALLQVCDELPPHQNIPAGSMLMPSSGTSGSAKICLRNPRCIIAEAENLIQSIPIYNNIRMRVTTNMNHAYAFGFGLMCCILSNSTLVLNQTFNPKKLLREETERPSDILAIVPPMIQPLLYLKEVESFYKLPKFIFTSGTACDQNLKKRLESAFQTKLFTNYGTTETGTISSTFNSTTNHGVGMALNNVEIKISNQDQYCDLGKNIGEVWIKSTSMMQKYLEDPNYINDYFNTKDLGTFDKEQHLHLIGRNSDIININGIKIDPLKIEAVLLKHAKIIDAAVYSGKAPDGNTIIFAAIRSHEKVDLTELKHYCYEHLNKNYVPDYFYLIDDIPRTPSGKCLKTKLPYFQQWV